MKKQTKKSNLEIKLLQQIHDVELPKPDTEVTFCDRRKWRFDIAWIELMLAVEVEGAIWSGGRHTRPVGFEKDIEKYNQAAIMGWTLIRVTTTMINNGRAIETIIRAYDQLYDELVS